MKMIDKRRVRLLKDRDLRKGPVIYWMSRDQRVKDNWALLFAQEMAINQGRPLAVIFCLVPEFLNATIRQYSFMIKGLQEVEENLRRKNIPFFLLKGNICEQIPEFIKRHKIGILVSDFNPLRITKEWKESISKNIDIPFYEVDTHNIIPCWLASNKQEYGARTLRPKIHLLLPDFLKDYPQLKRHPYSWEGNIEKIYWEESLNTLNIDRAVPSVEWIRPGERAAFNALKKFINYKLNYYSEQRNNPNIDGQSDLSPYIHFGHISSQRIALEVLKSPAENNSKRTFLEELIVRKELSDNFCFYNKNYDNFDGFPEWAKKTLNEHRKDKRVYLYTLEQFENGLTHDALWNAAQMEMVKKGKMHGYLRMYWAKKILEWTEFPEKAMEYAIYLNDKYELDGRDTNGYTGIAWSIGGVHDRAWNERPVFGKIRYMSYSGCRAKFDVKKYIER